MDLVVLLGIAAGLSADAFAVAVCKGLAMKRINYQHAFIIALFFGVFQAGMPIIGWALGTQFQSFITPVDHWIAFALLAFVGGKMLYEAFFGEEETLHSQEGPAGTYSATSESLDFKELTMLAIATSIDALAVGITFAFLQAEIISSAAVIGITTFALSLVGVAVGNRFGAKFERPATIVGGVVLILIGFKILLEHLGILVF